MRIGIFGVTNSGKSQFQKDVVRIIKEFGFPAENRDEHRSDAVWVLEVSREVLSGSAKGRMPFYDIVFYLRPDIISYLIFWFYRGRKWYKTGYWRDRGRLMIRPSDKRSIPIICAMIAKQLVMRVMCIRADKRMLRQMGVKAVEIRPYWTRGGKIRWGGFDFGDMIDEVERAGVPRTHRLQ